MTLSAHRDALDPMLPVAVRVASVHRETYDTCTVVTEPAGGALPGFTPGQFSMLYHYGVGEVPISISGDPGVADRLVYTIRAVGAVSGALINRRPGDLIGMRGPFGASWPVQEAQGKDVLIVAGGIGLAPLRPVIYHILRHRTDYGRLILLYGARSPRELLFTKELKHWNAQRDLQVLTTVDTGGGANWHGHVGVVTTLFDFLKLRPERIVAMTCGPEIMMRFVVRQLEAQHITDERIYLSMELNMKCAVGFCGHCQMGPYFLCKDGTVFNYAQMRRWMGRREL
ncbi:MAG TPA: FAD/NAD(P)-binding protein [Bryobacteraceae bacterium]|nr:FAD/NAD(P)-binding protein [Bryobacteraceae bacterium]